MMSVISAHVNFPIKTIQITIAGPEGNTSSLYQETTPGTWIPMAHTSRALTQCEQKYLQIFGNKKGNADRTPPHKCAGPRPIYYKVHAW